MSLSVFNGSPTVLAAVAGLLACALSLTIFGRRKPTRLPPGPRGWPIIGNLLDIPPDGFEPALCRDLCIKYDSDIVYLNVLGMSIIVLNSVETITDLLDARSSIYSSRPQSPMSDLMTFSKVVTAQPYGSFWRAHRRLIHTKFVVNGSIWHQPHQIRSVNNFLNRLLESPDKWQNHLRYTTGAMILDVAWGISAQPENDPYIQAAERSVAIASYAAQPGAFLVNVLPWMKHIPAWVPGTTFHKVAAEGKKAVDGMSSVPFQTMKKAVSEGTARPSFGADCLRDVDPDGDVAFQEILIENSACTLFGAGADTTISTVGTFFLAMIMYPKVQVKAQLELNTVLGLDRLPTFGDEDSLPYLTAIVKECLRWQLVLPTSIPHQSTADDEYKGYHIPKGTFVVPNTWAIMNDEKMYPNPHEFNPDRFLKDGKLDPSVRDPEGAFGYGRRICPGRHMAHGTVWLTAGSILAAFNLARALDPNGNVVEPVADYTSGLLRRPKPFACRIKPRSKKMEQIIQDLQSTSE